MQSSSHASAAVCIFKIESSRWLEAWWLALHVVLALTIAALDIGWTQAGLGWLGLALHAVLGRPRSKIGLLLECDGVWSAPVEQRYDMRLGSATAYSYDWVRLCLEPRGTGRALWVLLLRDQLDAEGWRRLQQRLRA